MTPFTEIEDRIFVLVEPMLQVNATLVVGDGQALVVDAGWVIHSPIPEGQPEKPEQSSKLS